MLTTRQAVALAHPCATPADTLAVQFGHVDEELCVSSILTVNK